MAINNSVLLSLVTAGRRAILPLAGEPLSITVDSLTGFLSLKMKPYQPDVSRI